MAPGLLVKSRRAMRIVYVTRHYHPAIGGAELHAKELAERHAARGHAVTVLTQQRSTGAPSLPERETIGGVEVIRFAPEARLRRRLNRLLRVRGVWRLGRTVLSPAQVIALSDGEVLTRPVRWALRHRPDVITTVNWELPEFFAPLYLAQRVLRSALVGMPLLHTEMPWTESSATADLMARSDALLANTEHEVRFGATRGFPMERMHNCGTGVEPSEFCNPDGRSLRERLGLGDGPVVGYVGRMQVGKGVLLLLEAMRAVWRSHPRARLLLAGRELPPAYRDHEAFRAALAGLDPADRARVAYIGPFAQEDKASIFAACDIFAMASTTDSFGQAYLAAWLCGRPVIGARVPAMECVIDHDVDGLLVAPRSAPALADAVLALLADPRRRDTMGAAGRAKTLGRFTWDHVTDRVEAAYRATLHQGRRSTSRRERRAAGATAAGQD